MIDDAEIEEVSLDAPKVSPSAEHVSVGVPIPKPTRVAGFSHEQWESFTQEWATSLKDTYVRVARFGGPGDFGIDVIGFASTNTFDSGWDNYQCKRYEHPLRPSDVWSEIGKIVYYSFKKKYPPPRKYYFVASRDIGTSLEKLLADPKKLKDAAKANWADHCAEHITTTMTIPLSGDLLDYFEAFDFSIFSAKTVVELIEGHTKTPFHAVRFGGGLPPRPAPVAPPTEYAAAESRYIRQLFDAYGEHLGKHVTGHSDLTHSPPLSRDFLRQRERFYHAESLRNFARDTVPAGTFEGLQNEVFHGVVDICDSNHANGFERMKATVSQAAALPTTSTPLASVVQVLDRQGICHQLANDDKLTWVQKDGEG